jgi:hypothetical protein
VNGTPRMLNRVLLCIVGAALAASGAFLLLLAAVPAAAARWRSTAARTGAWLDALLARTTLEGQRDSWLWLVLAVLMLLLVVLALGWVAAQGRGRTAVYAYDDGGAPVPGTVTVSAALAEQALKRAFGQRTDLLAATVSTYEFRGSPALKIRLLPRKGVAPHLLASEASALVQALDQVAGVRPPVLISISTGARTRFSHSDRVR